ncbi:hypothetical protein [Hespellia stercorisuis]|uniref:Uncharacterized protein n=1 Tax=Hespellia stercorisuis DSM 15480 TaxID=1121950 RepID=A0A1M6HGF2_9FIRM|nr:hypothetical protein [Hespellia stercorisuis]SHJ21262.1 hypothetical protein SAMN02745243_00012 [Hespellia stercorisuis DSM 15480]
MNIKIYRYLYVSESLERKKSRILGKLVSNELQPDIYVITLAANPQEQLEFYNSMLLKQKIFSPESLMVVGIARGYEDALYLVEEITRDVYEKTAGTDIRQYISERQNQYERS